MKKILENLAIINLCQFSKENKIDISGTHCVKNGRGFKWSLVKDDNGKAIITICFNKTSVPAFSIHK